MKKNLYFLLIVLALVGLSQNTSAQFSTIRNFSGGSDGGYPFGTLIYDGTYLYGLTSANGANGDGTIFKIKPDGTGFTKLYDFSNPTSGNIPMGALYLEGGYLYGMTSEGGTDDLGTIFKISTSGTGYTKLLDFDGAGKGSHPQGELISDGTYLYGITRNGGLNDVGVIFKIKPDGSSYMKLLDFKLDLYGGESWGSLYYDGTSLYGMTENGGVNSHGVAFKISTSGTGYTKLIDFSGAINGSTPRGSFVSDGTYLYGFTTYGGTLDEGVVFKILPNGTGYTKLLDMVAGTHGTAPHGSPILAGSTIYGLTIDGGASAAGVLFKVQTNGSGAGIAHDFGSSSTGSQPFGSLLKIGTSLYGMTYDGGSFGAGIIFKYDGIPVAIKEYNLESGAIYPNPSSGYFTIKSELLSATEGNTQLIVYNQLGEEVLRQEQIMSGEQQLDLSAQSNGIYLLKLVQGNQVHTQKLILQK